MRSFFPILLPLLMFSALDVLFIPSGIETPPGMVPVSPKRVVSLSPSLTRQIVDLQAEDRLVGVTTYHPPLKRSVDLVGTLIQPSLERIITLRPDTVLISEEDNPIQSVDRLRSLGLPVYTFPRTRSFEDICRNYLALARMLNREELAMKKLTIYRRRLQGVRASAESATVAFFISHRPLIAASRSSFIHQMLRDAGGRNILQWAKSPYPVLSTEYLAAADPDCLLSMEAGAPEFFGKLLKGLSGMKALSEGRIHSIEISRVPYYTPEDYVHSVEYLAPLIRGRGKSHE